MSLSYFQLTVLDMLLMQRLEPFDVLGMVLVDELFIGPCARHFRLWRRYRFANQYIDRDFVRQRREISSVKYRQGNPRIALQPQAGTE